MRSLRFISPAAQSRSLEALVRLQLNQPVSLVCKETGLAESDAKALLLAHKSNSYVRSEPHEVTELCNQLNVTEDQIPDVKNEMRYLTFRQVWLDNHGNLEETADQIEKIAFQDKAMLLQLRQNPVEQEKHDALEFELNILWQIETKRLRTIISGGTFTEAEKQSWLDSQRESRAVAEDEYQRLVVRRKSRGSG